MKFLFFAKYLYPPPGGAEISLLTLAKELAKQNKITVLCQGRENRSFMWNSVSIHYRNIWLETKTSYIRSTLGLIRWKKSLEKIISHQQPNLIITQLVFAPLGVSIARKFRIPSVLFVRSYEHFCPCGFTQGTNCDRKCILCMDTWKKKLNYFFFKGKMKWHEFALKKANLVISNSDFVKDICKRWYGVDSKTIYPFLILDDYVSSSKSNERYCTLIKPVAEKGVKIFMKIAKSCEKIKFLVVGRADFEIEKEFKKIKNIAYQPSVSNMKDIYAKTKILLVPSIWPEPFGRVCIEAMANGIPCIVSNRGGLPEAVGKAGIVIEDPFKIKSWLETIKRLNTDNGLYQNLSRRSKARAQKFDFKYTYREFEKIKNLYLTEN